MMEKMPRFLVSAFLLFALQTNVALAMHSSHPPMPTSEVFILLKGYSQDTDPVAALEKTNVDKWGGYRADGHYSKENQTVRFFPVPYGTFKIWIHTRDCEMVTGNFSFGEGVKNTEVTFDAQACQFTTYGFGT